MPAVFSLGNDDRVGLARLELKGLGRLGEGNFEVFDTWLGRCDQGDAIPNSTGICDASLKLLSFLLAWYRYRSEKVQVLTRRWPNFTPKASLPIGC